MKSAVDSLSIRDSITENLRETSLTFRAKHDVNLSENFIERNRPSNFFPFVIISVSLLFVILAKLLYWRSFRQLYESLVSFIKFRLWLRDTGSLLRSMFFLTTPAYLLIFALAADFLIQMYLFEAYIFMFLRYSAVFLLIFLIYGMRYVLMRLSAMIFGSETAVDEQVRNIQLHSTLLLFILIFLLPLSIYIPESHLYKAIAPVTVLTETIRIIKGVISAKTLKQYNVYYFFLYFCTVEILPVLILIKLSIALTINKI